MPFPACMPVAGTLWALIAGASVDTLPAEVPDTARMLQEVVVTGTRTARRRTESPVMVGVTDRKALAAMPVCVLSDALNFQPGLRVEVDCQSCNYTQLRMNGLAGSYSQILVNGRPIFGALMSLYGLEQIPADMVERIEVVRGGGSSLYGSSAVGGTVNVITRTPDRNGSGFRSQMNLVGGTAADMLQNAQVTGVSSDRRSGYTVHANRRDRQAFDANGDGYSELPMLQGNSGAFSAFLKPRKGRRLEASAAVIDEHRLGGEMAAAPVWMLGQAEERRQTALLANIDFQINSADGRHSLITYAGGQALRRRHYTGILPTDSNALAAHLQAPPFGRAASGTLQVGMQLDSRLSAEGSRRHVLTTGVEYLSESVSDGIPAYRYEVKQRIGNLGAFLQSDRTWTDRLSTLAGIRFDLHSRLPGRPVASPRMAFMYRPAPNRQLRVGYGRGFRAPQAFDTDLHMAFASGGVSRIRLSPDLREERSGSLSISWNADHAREDRILGYTLELFRTRLRGAFTLEHTGSDSHGETYEKRNGTGALVQGATAEFRINLRNRLQWEVGLTAQQARYAEPVEVLRGLPAEARFLRTPDLYGFANLRYDIHPKWRLSVSQVFTGGMHLVQFAGGNAREDRMVQTPPFLEHGFRLSYTHRPRNGKWMMECQAGCRNLTDARQADQDVGKNRDSNYVYGPALPRTLTFGVRVSRPG